MIVIYSIIDSIIHAFSSSLRLFDPERRVSTIIESFGFNKERLMLLFFSKIVFFIWVIWAVEKEVNNCFNIPTAIAEYV